MHVFVSWSGEPSKQVAKQLCQWLKYVLQELQPWMSALDIDAGELWEKEVHDHLEQAEYAIVCVTTENYQRPWLNYETGAIGTRLQGKTCPYLLRAEFNILTASPLSRYQARRSTRDDTKQLIDTLNRLLKTPLSDAQRDKMFETFWRELEAAIAQIPDETPASRGTDEKVDEMLTLVQSLATRAFSNTAWGVQEESPRWRKGRERLASALIKAGALPGFHIAPHGATEDGYQVSGNTLPIVYPYGFSEQSPDESIEHTAREMVQYLRLNVPPA